MTEDFRGYTLEARCRRRPDGRYSVRVVVSRGEGPARRSAEFVDEGVSLILEAEADKEALNLGRNLVARGLAGV